MKGINQKDGSMLKGGTDLYENQPIFLEKGHFFGKEVSCRSKGVSFGGKGSYLRVGKTPRRAQTCQGWSQSDVYLLHRLNP